MLEKSLGLLSLLLVLIYAHRPLIEVSLTVHTHDRARQHAAPQSALPVACMRAAPADSCQVRASRSMAPRRAAKRAPDSSDEEEDEEEELHGKPAPRKQGEPGALRFDKNHIISSVSKVQETMPSLLSQEDVQLWTAWQDSTPDALEHVPHADRPLPIKMPKKCSATRPSAVALAPPPREQMELISYKNPQGGRGAPPTLASSHLGLTAPLTTAPLPPLQRTVMGS